MTNHIERLFQQYTRRAGLVGPTGVPACSLLQLRETRLAWYFSALSLIRLIMDRVSAGEEVTEDYKDLMAGIMMEIDDFLREVETGRA